MILRRLAAALRRQDWSTVLVEIMIVVLGVFIGLQVQQWADAKRQVRLEGFYTQRLHDEVVDLLATRAPLFELRNQLGEALSTATQTLFDSTDRELTEMECRSIAFSFIVSNPTDDLASLLELQSSGQFSLFGNRRVSTALGSFLLTRARVRDAHAGSSRMAMNLPSRYPDLIRVLAPSDFSKAPWIFPDYRCDLAGMRTSQAFLNDLESNQMSYRFHVDSNVRINNSLRNLRQVLEDVLGNAPEASSP